jgi:hypothetical protein
MKCGPNLGATSLHQGEQWLVARSTFNVINADLYMLFAELYAEFSAQWLSTQHGLKQQWDSARIK